MPSWRGWRGIRAIIESADHLTLAFLTIQILDCRVRVMLPEAVHASIADVFAAANRWAEEQALAVRSEAQVTARQTTEGWQVLVDGIQTLTVPALDHLTGAIEWQVANVALRRLTARYLLVHAGALAFEGQGILLVAPSRSGKTTLTAGLIAAGCRYYSDDIAALTPSDLMLHPFLRSLCIKYGSFEVLSRSFPELNDMQDHARFRSRQVRYLAPPESALPEGPVPVRCIVFPRYTPGATTALAPLGRVQALPRLLDGLCNPRDQSGRNLPRMVQLLREADCYTLIIGDLDRAVDGILDAATHSTPARKGSISV